jgi:hypothetical protein
VKRVLGICVVVFFLFFLLTFALSSSSSSSFSSFLSSSTQFFATDAGFFQAAEACSLAIFILNVVFIIYWVYMWWLKSEYRAKAAKKINHAATRTSDGVRSMRSMIFRLSKSKSISNEKKGKKKRKKKRPSCLVTVEEAANIAETEAYRTGRTDASINNTLYEVENPLEGVDLELADIGDIGRYRNLKRTSMLNDTVAKEDDNDRF